VRGPPAEKGGMVLRVVHTDNSTAHVYVKPGDALAEVRLGPSAEVRLVVPNPENLDLYVYAFVRPEGASAWIEYHDVDWPDKPTDPIRVTGLPAGAVRIQAALENDAGERWTGESILTVKAGETKSAELKLKRAPRKN